MCVLCSFSPRFTLCPYVCVWALCAGLTSGRTQAAPLARGFTPAPGRSFCLHSSATRIPTLPVLPGQALHVPASQATAPSPCVCRHAVGLWPCALTRVSVCREYARWNASHFALSPSSEDSTSEPPVPEGLPVVPSAPPRCPAASAEEPVCPPCAFCFPPRGRPQLCKRADIHVFSPEFLY